MKEEKTFIEGDTVLYEGKPAKVIARTPKSVTILLGKRHMKTVLAAELEMDNGHDVEFR